LQILQLLGVSLNVAEDLIPLDGFSHTHEAIL
jgi:hypothetical protein